MSAFCSKNNSLLICVLKKFPDLFKLDDKSPKVMPHDQISSIETVEKELARFDATDPELAAAFRVALNEAKDYMTQFRADNIVRDAESVKDALLLPLDDEEKVSSCLPPKFFN